jgi:hypothetical protein
MVGCGLLTGLFLIGYLVFQIVSAFSKGEPPAMDALSPLIPTAVTDSARAMGILPEGDTVLYVFAPNGRGIEDGFFVTNRDLVAVKNRVATRYPVVDDYDLDIKLTPGRGYLLVNLPARGVSDTIYSDLTGVELQVLRLSLQRVFAMFSK